MCCLGLAGLNALYPLLPQRVPVAGWVVTALAFVVTAWYGREIAMRATGALKKKEFPTEAPLALAVTLSLATGAPRFASWGVPDLSLAAPFLLLFHLSARNFAAARIPDVDKRFRLLTWLVASALAAAAIIILLWLVLPGAHPIRFSEWTAFLSWIGVPRHAGVPGYALGAAIAVLAAASPVSLLLAADVAREEAACTLEDCKLHVRGSEVIDELYEVRIVAFDRSGTITEGEYQVCEVVIWGAETHREVLETAHALASYLPAVWGAAIRNRCAKDGIATAPLDEPRAIPGLGATGTSAEGSIAVGLPRLMRESGIDITEAADILSRCRAQARTALLVARDGVLRGAVVLKNPLKRDSVRAVRALAGMGVRAALVTPEARDDIAVLAEQAGITLVVGDVLPHDYANALDQLESETIGRILFVTAAEVDESTAGGNRLIAWLTPEGHAVAEHIPVTLNRGDVMAVVALLRLAHESFIKRVQNFAIAVAYHALIMPLAALGLVHPVLAGGLSLAACLVIGVNASRPHRCTA